MFGPKVAFWGAVIALVLILGGWFFVGSGDTPGFVEGVQQSELCKTNPDHWWCQLWGTE